MLKIYEQKQGTDTMIYVLVDNVAIAVDIIQIYEYPERRYPRYRVDFKGKTILSMATLTECKQKARQILRPYRLENK